MVWDKIKIWVNRHLSTLMLSKSRHFPPNRSVIQAHPSHKLCKSSGPRARVPTPFPPTWARPTLFSENVLLLKTDWLIFNSLLCCQEELSLPQQSLKPMNLFVIHPWHLQISRSGDESTASIHPRATFGGPKYPPLTPSTEPSPMSFPESQEPIGGPVPRCIVWKTLEGGGVCSTAPSLIKKTNKEGSLN